MQEQVLLFAVADYPVGMATSKRVDLLARCLKRGGTPVKVVLLHGLTSEQMTANRATEGLHEDIPFQYVSGRCGRPTGWFAKQWDTAKGILGACRLLIGLRIKKRLKGVIFYTPNGFDLFVVCALCWLIRAPYILEQCELRSSNRDIAGAAPRRILMRVSAYINERFVAKRSSGIVAISTSIARFYETKVGIESKRLFILPVLADHERTGGGAARHEVPPEKDPYFLLSGTLGEKDGLRFILAAFKRVAQRHERCKLILTGLVTKDAQRMLEEASGPESHRVAHLGFVSQATLHALIENAHGCLVCRTKSEFASFGVPTKLAEYLLAGAPVICTKVGDIPLYIGHEKECVMCEPENAEQISEAMERLLEDRVLRERIGHYGKIRAEASFTIDPYVDSLHNFVDSCFKGR